MILLAALALGIGSAFHCVAMCGGIAAMVAGIRNVIAYNFGRVASYAMFGAIAGAVGANAVFPFGDVRVGLRILATVIVALVGLRLLGIGQGAELLERIGAPLFTRLRPIASKLFPISTTPRALALGALWGWLPCGSVYAAASLALASGSFANGATTMLVFGLGTLPAMLLVGTFATRVRGWFARPWPRRFAGSLLVMSAVLSASGTIAGVSRDAGDPPVCNH